MSLGDLIPYEEPSEAEWAELERVVLDELGDESPARPAPSRRRATWALVAVGLVAAAAALWLRPRPDPAPIRSQTIRMATSTAPSATSLGEVHVQLGPGGSGVAVGGDRQGWVVTLESGRADFSVPPRGDRPSFVVQAGEVRVEVVGTRFSVTRHPRPGLPDRVEVTVAHGEVRVTSGGGAHLLRAGMRWSSAPVEPAPAGEVSREAAPPPPSTEASREPSRDPAPDDATLFRRASALESDAPDRASRLYAAIARRGGRWAGAALFARARLEHDRGDRVLAGRLADEYLRRFPDGVHASDARRLSSN